MINSTCSDGCLKCGKGSKCQICDLSNFYVNNAGTCQLRSAQNCHILSNKGNCLRCDRGFFLDLATQKCVKIEDSKKMPNCDFHYSSNQCALCDKYYYLNQKNQCQPVEIYVPGCKVHAQSTCLVCDDNKVLHPSKERCMESTALNQCASYGYLSCQKCKPGYVLNMNSFFETEDEGRFQKIEIMLRDIGRKEIDTQDVMLSPCQKLRDPKCLSFQDFKTCKQCQEFYYLDEQKVCQRYPIPAIRNCEKYSNYNICVQCTQGFLLSTPSLCVPVKNIDFCSVYDNTSAINFCIECQPQYFVQGNLCMKRLITVDKCQEYHKKMDSCSLCETGFVLSDDNLKCFPLIENCSIYEPSSETSTQLTCKICNSKHYLENGTCKAGTLSNCLNYTSPNICQTCENKFYWGTTVQNSVISCQPHEDIQFCGNYSQIERNRCDLCDDKHLLLKPLNSCEAVSTKIPQCINYLTLTECDQCKDGYYLVSPTVCEPIPEEQSCLRKIGGTVPCVMCKNGYVLNNGLCQKPLDFQISLCSEWSQLTTNEEITCNHCKTNSIFVRGQKNFGHCVNQLERQTYFTKTNINNCEHLSIDQIVPMNGTTGLFPNQVRCVRCKEGFKISEDQTECLENCPNQTLLVQRWNEQNQKITNSRCMNIVAQTNCDIVSPIMKLFQPVDENEVTCVKCKSGFIRVDDSIDYVSVNPEDLTSRTPLGVHYLGFKCALQDSFNFHTTNSTSPPPNCVAYRLNINSSKWECRRCKQGWTGMADSTNNDNLLCNKKVEDCDESIYWGGFFQYARNDLLDVQRHLTCHSCYTRGKIPFVFLDSNKKVKPFGIEYGDLSFSSSVKKEAAVTQCFEESALHFRIPEDRYSTRFPENCGVGLVFVDQNKDYRTFYKENSWENTMVQCMHCKPGFRPLLENNFITKCEMILNCEEEGRIQKQKLVNKWFNGCSNCKNGFTWMATWDNINTRFTVDFDRCVSNQNDQQCLAYSESHQNGQRCVLCKNGFHLNRDGICEKLRAPLCNEGESFHDQINFKKNFTNHNLFYEYYINISGCRTCSSGYQAFSVLNKDYLTCFNSNYDFVGRFIQSTNYVANCKNYKTEDVTGHFLCQKCQQGFILSSDYKSCISLDSYPNCALVNMTNRKCQTCNQYYVNVDGYCEKPIIKFCKTYDNVLNYQKCLICEDEYKLVNNHCLKGQVKYCKVYNGQNCTSCLEDYHLLSIKNGQYCIKKLQDQNCGVSVINNLTREWQCNQCNFEFVITTDDTKRKRSICTEINLIENCEKYHNTLGLIDSEYTCLKCETGYFLNKNQCFKRIKQTDNCMIYSETQDFCIQCNEGHYLSNEKICEQFPKGIPNCRVYDSLTTCTLCDQNYYLDTNQCQPQPIERRIKWCLFYSNPMNCSHCERGFYLINNTCIKANATNCNTYVNMNQCRTCLPGHGFYKDHETGMVHCIYISTQNCQISENQYPFDCLKCNKLYFLDKGKCFANQTYIPNCEDYEQANTCKKCEDEYILSYDKRRCMNNGKFGFKSLNNCIDNQERKQPVCHVCKPGYQLYRGNCVECKTQTQANGCMSCQGVDQENEECVLCTVGWFMNDVGKCTKNTGNVTTIDVPLGTSTTQPDTTQPDTTNPDTTNPDTTNPDTNNPDTTNPDTTNPNTTNPDTNNPDTTNPDTTNPDTTNTDTTNTDTTNTDTTNTDTTNTDTTNTDTTNTNTTNTGLLSNGSTTQD